MFLSLKNICGRSGNQIDSWLTIDLTDNKVEDIWNCRNWSHFPGCPKPPLVVASQNVGCCVKPRKFLYFFEKSASLRSLSVSDGKKQFGLCFACFA